jgi:hypothetical protein
MIPASINQRLRWRKQWMRPGSKFECRSSFFQVAGLAQSDAFAFFKSADSHGCI